MITRQDLDGKDLQQVQQELQLSCTEYQAQLEQMEMSELNNEESKIVQEMNSYDQYLNEVVYELPKSVEYDGKKVAKNTIVGHIVNFVNRMEVEWQFTLGMYQMVKLWKNIQQNIGYREYDSTLRVLGQVKYKGENDWENILVVNEFLSSPQDVYARDNIYMAYLAELHNAILNKMKAFEQAELPEMPNEVLVN